MIFKNMRKCQEKLNDEFPIKFIKHFILANDSELEIFLRVEIKSLQGSLTWKKAYLMGW